MLNPKIGEVSEIWTFDEFAKSPKGLMIVIPAKAGIQ